MLLLLLKERLLTGGTISSLLAIVCFVYLLWSLENFPQFNIVFNDLSLARFLIESLFLAFAPRSLREQEGRLPDAA